MRILLPSGCAASEAWPPMRRTPGKTVKTSPAQAPWPSTSPMNVRQSLFSIGIVLRTCANARGQNTCAHRDWKGSACWRLTAVNGHLPGKKEDFMSAHSTVAVIVGSLRKGSHTRRIAQALMSVAPASLSFRMIEIGDLPLYNEDLDDRPPAPWVRLRQELSG